MRPGAKIINASGDLVLSKDWDLANSPLAPFRFGPNHEPGVLTLRAAGNLIFEGALSDGFGPAPIDSNTSTAALWEASLLPAGSQSWSYRLVSGTDFGRADFHRVQPLASLGNNSGSLRLGRDGGINISIPFGPDALTSAAVAGHYQVIRTGTGDITISAGRDVQLLNQFATIYTAGTQVGDPTMNETFDVPILKASGGEDALGAVQENPAYPAQYSTSGGNVTIAAQGDILHQTQDNSGNLIPDSERQLPSNWIYRRGYVDPATGQFGKAKFGDTASPTWWVDFSNFFEGVGALGGGNVSLIAGHNVSNIDAVVPTNARMAKGTPSAANTVELGSGDLVIRAGRDIDGGVYYVERGSGTLRAGNTIHTNSTRSPSLTNLTSEDPFPAETWLPTTLFRGQR